MKKTFKKLMAALLAVALLCAMAVPAFAAEGASGTITIDNALNGESYTAYKISMLSVPKKRLTAARPMFIRSQMHGLISLMIAL